MMFWVRLIASSLLRLFFATRYNEVLNVVRSSSGTGGAPRKVPLGTSKLSYARLASAIAAADSIGIRTGVALVPYGKRPLTSERYFSVSGIATSSALTCFD